MIAMNEIQNAIFKAQMAPPFQCQPQTQMSNESQSHNYSGTGTADGNKNYCGTGMQDRLEYGQMYSF